MSLIPKELEEAFLLAVYRDLLDSPISRLIAPPIPTPPEGTVMQSRVIAIEYPTIAFGPYGECIKEMRGMVLREDFMIEPFPTYIAPTTE